MSAISLRLYKCGVKCDACVLTLIWNPDAFNQITGEPEQDDDGPRHTLRPGCFLYSHSDVGHERFWNPSNATIHADTLEITGASPVPDKDLEDALADVPLRSVRDGA